MRSVLIGVIALIAGTLGGLGYSHYFGDGQVLAQAHDEINAADVKLVKNADVVKQFKSETDALTEQVQQLTTTNDDLKHQVDQLKSAANPPPTPNPLAGMAGMMKIGMAQRNQERFLMLKSRLHLTPEQEAAVQAAMDSESKRAEDMAAKMLQGGKIDPQAIMAQMKDGPKSLDQTLDDILTPDQKTAYDKMKTDEKDSQAETVATMEMNQMAPLLQLNDTQKDQVYSTLYQVHQETQDPTWIKNNMPANSNANPLAILDVQEKAKEDALSKVLTPEQMATYQQQEQSQLDMQKAMMQKFMPNGLPGATPSNTSTAPAPGP